MRLTVVALALVLSSAAQADTIAPSGQPFCTTAEGLHAYLAAAVTKDSKALSRVSGCAVARGGLKMEVIDRGETVVGMHVDKVRLFGAKGSAVGYTVNIDP